ncbi:hypothetical protein TeGR_g1914 [Tetraparma gracilis]|uniref:Uncharacterized protein n=1 Tax=Tetraparma gracilis TaxID=2962635 RepID=A0ABQ6M912_9STRA|nr:hypothetical protein TeGR_g1914 [Tetraparma gracilis]
MSLLSWQLCKRLNFDDPATLLGCRLFYLSYQLAAQLLAGYALRSARLNDDRSEVRVPSPLAPLLSGALSAAGPAASSLLSSALSRTLTVREYDSRQARALRTSQLLPLLLMFYLHFRRGAAQPLVLQAAVGYHGLWQSPLWRVGEESGEESKEESKEEESVEEETVESGSEEEEEEPAEEPAEEEAESESEESASETN